MSLTLLHILISNHAKSLLFLSPAVNDCLSFLLSYFFLLCPIFSPPLVTDFTVPQSFITFFLSSLPHFFTSPGCRFHCSTVIYDIDSTCRKRLFITALEILNSHCFVRNIVFIDDIHPNKWAVQLALHAVRSEYEQNLPEFC